MSLATIFLSCLSGLFVLGIFALVYLLDAKRRKSLYGKVAKEFLLSLALWACISIILIPSAGKYPFWFLLWMGLLPFGYFYFLINRYWLIPAYQKKGRKIFFYIISNMLLGGTLGVYFFGVGIWGLSLVNYGIGLHIFLFVGTIFISLALSWFFYLRNEKRYQLFSLKKELGESASHLQFLRSQINPHFLFNALNALYGMAIKENAVRTGDGIQRLGDMMRFMLRDNQKDMIPLTGEISYLKDYIYIQQLRLADSENIQLTMNIREPEQEYFIVPMLLVPFVENAFKHGVRLQEKSWIDILLFAEDGVLHFEVRNSVHSQAHADTEKASTGIGLENVKERLILLYPGRHHLKINKNEIENIVQFTLTL